MSQDEAELLKQQGNEQFKAGNLSKYAPHVPVSIFESLPLTTVILQYAEHPSCMLRYVPCIEESRAIVLDSGYRLYECFKRDGKINALISWPDL